MPLLNSGENVQLCIFIFDPRGFIWVTGFLAPGYLIYLQDGTCVGVSTYSFNPVCFVWLITSVILVISKNLVILVEQNSSVIFFQLQTKFKFINKS